MRVHSITSLPHALQAELALSDGPVSGLLCPSCEGGRTGERSLGARPAADGSFALYCFRAGCGYKARVFGASTRVEAPRFTPRRYTGELDLPDADLRRLLAVKYGLNRYTVDSFVRGVPGRLAAYMPVYSPFADERGAMLRYLDGTEPKVVSYKATDQPWQAWYVQRPEVESTTLVVVEDQISAMKCWQLGFDAVALLGTNLNREKVEEIADSHEWAYLALDKDAFGKAIEYARKWPFLRPVLLERDLKDVSDGEVLARLEG